ncbi:MULTISPECIES: hypothetical protein [Cupriavidus]
MDGKRDGWLDAHSPAIHAFAGIHRARISTQGVRRTLRAVMAMRKMALVTLWLAGAMIANAFWWATHPDVAPNFSGPLWRGWLALYGAKNASQEDDAAFLASSLCLVLLAAVFLWWWRRAGRR